MNETIDIFAIEDTAYEVKKYVAVVENTEQRKPVRSLPVLDLKMGSDYDWQLLALKQRILHPELFEKEDVNASIISLSKWIEDYELEHNVEDATEKKLFICYDILKNI